MSEPRPIEDADITELLIDVAYPSAYEDSPFRKAAWDEIKRRVRQPASEPASELVRALEMIRREAARATDVRVNRTKVIGNIDLIAQAALAAARGDTPWCAR